MATPDLRTPGVYTVETQGLPRATAASNSIAGFVGFTKKGPIDKALLVTSYNDFAKKYGSYYLGNYMPFVMTGFFEEGGKQAYIARAVGAGDAVAEIDLNAVEGGPATSGTILSSNSEPYILFPSGLTIVVDPDAGGNQTVTITGTQGARTGAAGTFDSSFAGGEDLTVIIDGGSTQTISFAAAANSSAANIASVINQQIVGASSDVSGGQVRITSDTYGTGSSVNVTGGTGRALIGLAIGSTSGTGSAVNIKAMTATEVATAINAQTTDCTAVAVSGKVRITSDTTGTASSIEVDATSTADTIIGFDNTLHSGAATSSEATLKVLAHNPGAWGNAVKVSTTRWTYLTTATLSNGGTSVTLDSIRDVEVGDIVFIGDLDDLFAVVHVRAITPSTKTITFKAVTLTGPIASGAVAKSSSMHRKVTTSTAATLTTDTMITVADPNGFRVGSVVIINDSASIDSFIVTGLNGNVLLFGSALGTAFLSGAIVSSQEFILQVTEEGVNTTPYEYLSMEPTNDKDYVEIRFGASNSSFQVELQDSGASSSLEAYRIPLAINGVSLIGGADGSALVDNDYIGSDSAPYSGMYLLLEKTDLNYFSVPGQYGAAVLQSANTLSGLMKEVEVIAAMNPALVDVDDILNFRNYTLGVDSTHFALYYPWIQEADPFNRTVLIDLPPEGRVAGAWALTARTRGIHAAPANIPFVNVLGLTKDVTDGEQDLLNPRGINVIRLRPGRGIRIWGARTLTSETDGRQYIPTRRLLSFIERSIRNFLEIYVFEPREPGLFARIETSVGAFFRGLYNQGVFGSKSETRSYFVKCDEENNPEDSDNTVICDAGINPVGVAEFILFRIGTWDGGSSLQEEIARRG